MLFLYSPPRACVVSTRRAVVSMLSIFGRAVWTLHPSAGRVAAFVFCCTKRAGRVILPTKGRTLHTRQKNSAGAASSSPHGGRVCVRLSTLSIFGAVCFSCSCGIASTRRPSVSILSTLSIFGRAVDAAPAPLSSSFGAFSIRRARAVVLVSYSLNAGRYHIGRRLDAAPPRRAVLRLSGFALLLHEKDGAGDTSNERANAAHAAKEQRGAASSSPHFGAVVRVVYICPYRGRCSS